MSEHRQPAFASCLEAVRRGAHYRLEGSEDWESKPGKLTVTLDLNSEEWDEVYDALDEIEGGESLISQPGADRVG